MDIDNVNIVDAISNEDEFMRILPLIENIAIIEYDGSSITGSIAIAHILKKCGIGTDVIKRVFLLGKKTTKTKLNEIQLAELYPNVTIEVFNKVWREINPRSLKMSNTLVFHVGISIGITEYMFDKKIGKGEDFVNFVNKTRVAYYMCLLNTREHSFFENPYTTRCQLRLKDFALETIENVQTQTTFCKDKQDYIENCINTLTEQDAFFQCIEEAEHGCEDCNQCGRYGSRKQCPYAQRIVAKYYRDGVYVPQNFIIAHQWEVMASRQDYKPACIQVADDLKDAYGCKKDIDAALEIYSSYASQIGNEHCINQILEIAEKESDVDRLIAIPYIAQQAQDGNEDMIIKLSDAFQNADYGLPKDMVQQKEWIEQGAENGNPRFVLAMALMYEENGKWDDSYKWYKTLEKVAPEMLVYDKLDEIELKMLTNGSTPDEVAKSGENYLFGYFGTNRDLHLAYRCLKYASDNNVACAKGLLGLMYLKGWDIEEDFNHAIELLTEAAQDDDLVSMDILTDLHYDNDNEYNDGYKWENIIVDKIEEGVSKNLPYAFYLKGHYYSIGYQYDEDDYSAFENIKKAAELGLPKAQFELSEMYSSGTGCMFDSSEAYRWLKTAAENGYYEAEGKYGIELFDDSSIFSHTRHRSFPFLKKAYKQGYDEVYWCLGQCYMHGIGTTANKELAYPLYQEAAKNGILKAQVYLCEKYFGGDDPLPKDYKLCAKWGEEAIKQGNKSVRFKTAYSSSHLGNHDRAKELYLELANEGDAAAMNNYACELSNSKEKAEWFQKAADNGDDYGLWNIAKYYKNGTGVEKDIDKALELYRKAADKGCTGAMTDLAEIYRYGDNVEKDGDKAIEWYQKAADKDELCAIMALAKIFSEGKIVAKDMDKAIHYYKLAAEKDCSSAPYELGQLYENGDGVEQNTPKAIYWYRKAANKGNYSAKESLKHLNSNWLDEEGNVAEELDDENDNLSS